MQHKQGKLGANNRSQPLGQLSKSAPRVALHESYLLIALQGSCLASPRICSGSYNLHSEHLAMAPPKTRSKNKTKHPGEDAKKALRTGLPPRRTKEEVEEARRLEAEKAATEQLVRDGTITSLADIQKRLEERDGAEQSHPAALSANVQHIQRGPVGPMPAASPAGTSPVPVSRQAHAAKNDDSADDGTSRATHETLRLSSRH